MSRTTKLPIHPRLMVLNLLTEIKKPLTPYEILAQLKQNGINSAPIVYRALQELEKQGSVHKLSSLGAYLACNEGCEHKSLALITICAHCKNTHEINNTFVTAQINSVKNNGINLKDKSVIELPIVCESCN